AERARGSLALQGGWVRYPPKDDTSAGAGLALRGIDLAIAPGEVVAFVGPSGSGKTTLVNLLPRFVEVERGTVTLDGVPLPDWDLGSLRRQFAMVSQDVVMLNDTLAANVALGASDEQIDDARARAALESANLGDLLAKLPQGMHTNVGHNA